MLAGVLLHVVESPAPIDGAIDLPTGDRRLDLVRDSLLLVDDVEHRDPRDGAQVVRLSAGGWVEGRPIEVDGASVFGAVDDRCAETAQIGIGIVETFRHVGH